MSLSSTTPAGPQAGPAGGALAIEVVGLSKSYPGVRALRGVDFAVATGEVHALVGENGAGKSTLIKLIAGAEPADAGTVSILGRQLDHAAPRSAADAGVGVIYQELTIIPHLSATANVFLGRMPSHAGVVSRRAARAAFRRLAERVDAAIDPDVLAGTLSVAQQQMLEIMRALAADRRILIMDEPTASLGRHERDALLRVVDDLRRTGHAIVYISHDLGEVLRTADRVSVMRDGALVATRAAHDTTERELVSLMLGAPTAHARERARDHHPAADAPQRLSVTGVSVPGTIDGVSLSVRAGEVLGIAGLVGAGRTELLRAIAGADPTATGHMRVDGRDVPWPTSVRAALRHGIALAPEDRKSEGLILGMAGYGNVILSDQRAAADWAGVLRPRAARAQAAEVTAGLGFDSARLGAPARTLSGGNQQKLVLGKWLHRRPRLLLLDEPTRGIDIGAKAEIYSVIARLTDEGMAVIVVSSELEEVLELSDRVLVMAGGRAVATLDRAEATVAGILAMVFHLEEEAAA